MVVYCLCIYLQQCNIRNYNGVEDELKWQTYPFQRFSFTSKFPCVFTWQYQSNIGEYNVIVVVSHEYWWMQCNSGSITRILVNTMVDGLTWQTYPFQRFSFTGKFPCVFTNIPVILPLLHCIHQYSCDSKRLAEPLKGIRLSC
jgi:hypothetical protein